MSTASSHRYVAIHPTAIIDPTANLANDVQIGPWTVIGPHVDIASGTVIHSHVVIKGPTTIGHHNQLFQFASVGEDCQDKKYDGEPTRLIIGDNNIIREGCTIHRGTVQGGGLTRIGDGNLLMAYVHIAHDCTVNNHCILANNTTLGGHVVINDGAILGGFTGVHQFCRIGSYSMSAVNAVILKDVPAFVMVSGNPARAHGMNVEGMRRRGYSKGLIQTLRQCYKIIYREKRRMAEAITCLESMPSQPEVQWLIDSLKTATRGIVR